MRRTRGRSAKGVKAVKSSRVLKGTNITLIAAISPAHGLIHYETHESSKINPGVTAKRFDTFISNLIKSPIVRSHSFFFIVDNAKIHKRDEIEHILSQNKKKNVNHHRLYLPPYTPALTPIENLFSIWKKRAKLTYITDKQHLYRHIYEDSTLITPDLCHSCYEHTLSYFPLIAEGGDII